MEGFGVDRVNSHTHTHTHTHTHIFLNSLMIMQDELPTNFSTTVHTVNRQELAAGAKMATPFPVARCFPADGSAGAVRSFIIRAEVDHLVARTIPANPVTW